MAMSSEDAIPSSPKRPPIFSSEGAITTSSPPSSPPGFPWEYTRDTTQPTPKALQMNAFSILGKRKALNPISDNAPSTKKPHVTRATTTTNTTKLEASSTPIDRLTQMQLSLGQKVQKKCVGCGMSYVPSSAEDRRYHDRFHKQGIEGCDVGRHFATHARAHPVLVPVTNPRRGSAQDQDTAVICVVDGRDPDSRRKRAKAVLDVVQRDLGAVDIPVADLWAVDAGASRRRKGERHHDGAKSEDGAKDDDGAERECPFRAFMYIKGTKCVGFLLTQKIQEAYAVLEPTSVVAERKVSVSSASRPESRSAADMGKAAGKMTALEALRARQRAALEADDRPLQVVTRPATAALGISRIWTAPSHRRQKIGIALLDAALAASSQRSKGAIGAVTKEQVAFSQPTKAGTELARKWFGRRYGWLVYVD